MHNKYDLKKLVCYIKNFVKGVSVEIYGKMEWEVKGNLVQYYGKEFYKKYEIGSQECQENPCKREFIKLRSK